MIFRLARLCALYWNIRSNLVKDTPVFEYIHLPQCEELGPKGRSYILTERTIEFKGRKVLILDTEAYDMSFCDSSYARQLRSLIVKGYIEKWKYRTISEGLVISLLEPPGENEEKKELFEYIRKAYNVDNVV